MKEVKSRRGDNKDGVTNKKDMQQPIKAINRVNTTNKYEALVTEAEAQVKDVNKEAEEEDTRSTTNRGNAEQVFSSKAYEQNLSDLGKNRSGDDSEDNSA
ncbi:hypothetical protein HAX54_039921 [Datura stramonium]|uniref:Uncharacterized protein n=1 Tax=Datura stramonium TaxID=4076 RepID=A0ABS8SJR6_DATST|nr:hypothetical protein [Datura stramonium]